jgi:hypothetical protein
MTINVKTINSYIPIVLSAGIGTAVAVFQDIQLKNYY